MMLSYWRVHRACSPILALSCTRLRDFNESLPGARRIRARSGDRLITWFEEGGDDLALLMR
jgi:hypothetical protein